MAETKARFLANLIGATSTDNDFILPNAQGDPGYVLSSGGNGTTTWEQTVSAPTITSVSGLLNDDSDSTLTILGTEYSATSTVKLFGASSGGSEVASSSSLNTSGIPTKLVATFGHANLTKNATLYVEVSNAGVTARHGTGITVSGDPIGAGSTASDWFSNASGANHNDSTHLGTYASAVVPGNDSNTEVLLNFDNGGGTTITNSASGGSHAVTANGNAVIKSSPFGDGKSALFFDGSDYLDLPNHEDFNFGTGDVTIEFFLHVTGTNTYQDIWGAADTGIAFARLQLKKDASGSNFGVRFTGEYDTGGSVQPHNCNTPEGVIKPNTWHHVAFTRSGTEFQIFVDGVKQTLTVGAGIDSTHNLGDFTNNRIGATGYDTSTGNAGSSNHFTGYLDEIRVVKGTKVYSDDFTVPTSRLSKTQSAGTNISAITGTATKLLIHSNTNHKNADRFFATGAFENQDGWNFDGSNDLLQTNLTSGDSTKDINWHSDVTIEMWVQYNSGSSNDGIFTTRDTINSGSNISLATSNGTGSLKVVGADGDGTDWDLADDVAAGDIDTGMWNYILFRKYVDGSTRKFETRIVKGNSYTSGGAQTVTKVLGDFGSAAFPTDLGDDLRFGYWQPGAQYTDYDIKHIRVSNIDRTASGQDRYHSDSTKLTIPAYDANVASDSNTVLLYNQPPITDSSDSGHNISATGACHSYGYGGKPTAMAWPNNLKTHGSAGIYFDGTTDYLQLPDSADLRWTNGSYSIDFWMYLSSLPTGSSGDNAFMLMYDGNDAFDNSNFSFSLDAVDGLTWKGSGQSDDGGISQTEGNMNNWETNRWYHIAVTRDALTSFKVYRDGKKILSQTNASGDLTSNGRDWYGIKIGGGTATQMNNYDTLGFHGFLDSIRIQIGAASFSGDSTTGANFTLPTQIYGANTGVKTIPTITFAGTATSPSLAGDEDLHFTEVENTSNATNQKKLSDLGLTFDNTYGNANQASLTGNLNLADNVQVNYLGVKVQVRKTLSNSAGTSGQATITFSSGTTTAGLSPDMVVTGTGINSSETKITSVDSTTQITVDNNHAGTVSGDLIFYDPDRVHFINKGGDSNVWDNPTSGGLSIKG